MSTDSVTTVQFRLPDLGEGVVETEIIRWLVGKGESIVEDAPMVEVMTDKATVEIPAPTSGRVAAICAVEGAVVQVGSVIIEIEAAAGSQASSNAPVNAPTAQAHTSAVPAQASATSASLSPGRVQATPMVRRRAAALGVDLATVVGTGPNGRITEDDVAAAASGSVVTSTRATAAVAGTTRVPLRGMRGQIARHLTAAQLIPTVTVVEEADVTALAAMRAETGLAWSTYVARAAIRGFEEVPELNSHVDSSSNEIVRFDEVHMGVAVQSEEGLVVPVVRDARKLSAAALDAAIATLAEQARAGSLSPESLRGGTFTITCAGKFGGLFTTPLLNAPEVGILGLHRIIERPVVVDGDIVIRKIANLSISFDHRAIDGVTASRYLLAVISAIHDPASLQ